MTNLREQIEKILEQVLMKHHDDISKQDDDAIAEATDQILQAFEEVLPEEKQGIKFHSGRQYSELSGYSPIDNHKRGFNTCLAQIRERIGER